MKKPMLVILALIAIAICTAKCAFKYATDDNGLRESQERMEKQRRLIESQGGDTSILDREVKWLEVEDMDKINRGEPLNNQ